MKTPPQMPPFGGQAPLIGQRQQQMQAQIQAAIGQLGLGIYTHLATGHIATRDEHQAVDQDHLRQLAKDAQAAAICYFQGIGVVQQEGETK